jgi:hypothetical protein
MPEEAMKPRLVPVLNHGDFSPDHNAGVGDEDAPLIAVIGGGAYTRM